MNVVRRAVEEPMRWIAANAGHEASIVMQRVKEMNGDEGFNALTERYEDLVAAGVIDPAKVVRSALQNAASVAALLLTTEADAFGDEHQRPVLVVEKPEMPETFSLACGTVSSGEAWLGANHRRTHRGRH
jgi:chaperonin GroEL (HSP60 family)